MKHSWKILEIKADGEVITQAKYFVTAQDSDNTVETEGYWVFKDQSLEKPFAEVTEQDVIEWIFKETTQFGQNFIESRLEEQLASMSGNRVVVAPWMPQIYTPNL